MMLDQPRFNIRKQVNTPQIGDRQAQIHEAFLAQIFSHSPQSTRISGTHPVLKLPIKQVIPAIAVQVQHIEQGMQRLRITSVESEMKTLGSSSAHVNPDAIEGARNEAGM
jgi:hypothetical protein